jgi:hypothetical protein
MLGYSPEELIGMHVLQAHPPHRRDEVASVIRLMLAHELNSCHIPLLTKSGEQIAVETRVEAGRWSGREVLFGVSRDITCQTLTNTRFLTTEPGVYQLHCGNNRMGHFILKCVTTALEFHRRLLTGHPRGSATHSSGYSSSSLAAQ